MKFVKVRVLDTPYHIDNEYEYYLPPALSETTPGTFVVVPFGTSNRRSTAVVVSISDTSEYENVKPVLAAFGVRFSLNGKMLGLLLFLSSHNLCSIGEALSAIMPYGIAKSEEIFTINGGKNTDNLTAQETRVYDYIRVSGKTSYKKICAELGRQANEIIGKLSSENYIYRDIEIREPVKAKTKTEVILDIDFQTANNILDGKAEVKLRSEKAKAIVRELLSAGGSGEKKELLFAANAKDAQVKQLTEKNLVFTRETEVDRNPYYIKNKRISDEIILNEEQKIAFDKLKEIYNDGKNSGKSTAALLFGITGSGKTSVMKAMIDEVLRDPERGVIVLVPEIALTPQTVNIFSGFYGNDIAVLHSSLTKGERYDAYRKIADGKARLVIGTRSAVFAPVPKLGMIIIDEEQEHTYKSDSNPKYHTHDVAAYRLLSDNGLLLLASATPSVETYNKAVRGKINLVELTQRYGGARLPKVFITDMREELSDGNTLVFGRLLAEKMRKAYENGGQSIIFINRRGYNNFLSCVNCGKPLTCPHCSVSLTYHKGAQSAFLACHYCGYKTPPVHSCPTCGGQLKHMGSGTQKAEEEIKLFLPEARVLRMDADTMENRAQYENLLSDFREKRGDILLGTQMVAKGHDFPAVTLVGVLLADASLYLGDFHASERTFSMITQVVGRAGRAQMPGEAVIQTFTPDNETIKLAAEGDYKKFYNEEIKLRRAFTWQPFCDIALFTLTGENEDELNRAAIKLLNNISELAKNEYPDLPLVIFGPFEAPVYKVKEKFRLRIVIKCKSSSALRTMFARIVKKFTIELSRRINLSLDINPTNL